MTGVTRKAALAAIAPLVVLGAVALEVVSYLALRRYGQGIDGMSTVAWEEFPEITPELLEKFSSFDARLGWSPQPNTKKRKDTGDHLPGEELETVVEYSTDEYGSRISQRERDPDADVTLSTYGDSYCFCRGVNDDETIQHYLSERLDTHVSNYGGGNYGFDQALMRLERKYPEDPTDYVAVIVTASSMARILSVWKHYQEFGNVLAVKPRYTLEDGELERLSNPIDEKDDMLDLESRAETLRAEDHHYDPWFLSHLAGFPYTSSFLQYPDQVRYALYGALTDLESRYDVSVPGIDAGARLAEADTALEKPKVDYHDDLYDEESDLFEALVGEFVDYADEQEFTPVFVMVQQLRYAKFGPEDRPIYGDLLGRLDERYDDLQTVDMAERLTPDDGDVESLYVRRGEGGHYSPQTNERIAEVLLEEAVEEDVGEKSTASHD
ncbi:hypothetical protein BRC94_12100 [Halobacteriales archaeon QS_5_70_17]|nr:MAG: hypothetical protein BRC94_12100 [Halobacteriales archaeon QS_5_70_17]